MGEKIRGMFQIVQGKKSRGDTLEDWLNPGNYVVPSDTDVEPVTQNQAKTIVAEDPDTGVATKVAKVIIVPRRFGRHFIVRRTLLEAYLIMDGLLQGAFASTRPDFVGIQNWIEVAMTATTADGPSVLTISWKELKLSAALLTSACACARTSGSCPNEGNTSHDGAHGVAVRPDSPSCLGSTGAATEVHHY